MRNTSYMKYLILLRNHLPCAPIIAQKAVPVSICEIVYSVFSFCAGIIYANFSFCAKKSALADFSFYTSKKLA
jgi:hypothetical protein